MRANVYSFRLKQRLGARGLSTTQLSAHISATCDIDHDINRHILFHSARSRETKRCRAAHLTHLAYFRCRSVPNPSPGILNLDRRSDYVALHSTIRGARWAATQPRSPQPRFQKCGGTGACSENRAACRRMPHAACHDTRYYTIPHPPPTADLENKSQNQRRNLPRPYFSTAQQAVTVEREALFEPGLRRRIR